MSRQSRTVIDPKVRQVGFFAPPDRSQSTPIDTSSTSPPAPTRAHSLSSVMIPVVRPVGMPVPVPVPVTTIMSRLVSLEREGETVYGSYNPSEKDRFLSRSPLVESESSRGGWEVDGCGGEWSEDGMSVRSGKVVATSLPSGGIDKRAGGGVAGVRGLSGFGSKLMNVFVASKGGVSEKAEGPIEIHDEPQQSTKTLKEKTSKAERRAIQEAQRAAKAAAKADGGIAPVNPKPAAKTVKLPPQKKDSAQVAASVAASEKKGSDRLPEKDRKKDVPHPRMQFDDTERVEKAKKRAVVKQTEARNRVELFRHLPQYEQGTQLPDLQSKFFQLEPMHPAVYKVGLHYLTGDVSGGNARCIALLEALKDVIRDYTTPQEKSLVRDLTAKLSSYVSFLIECRPLSISMGNAIKFLKNRVAKLPLTLSESEAKETLQSEIDRFINEKIILADKVIVELAVTKISDGDVLLTYGAPSVVEMILLHAHELGKQFRVVIVDSRPKLEGQGLLRRLVAKGLSCTYTHINAISYIMHEVTRVFLGASSVLSNGTVYSRVGTASVAMVAHAFRIPVLICCEAYKFHERVQLDSICSNELGDPEVISKVVGRKDVNYLDDWTSSGNLQLLNLLYDATPSDYVSIIITDYGMVPPTSVPVIVREYRRKHLWI